MFLFSKNTTNFLFGHKKSAMLVCIAPGSPYNLMKSAASKVWARGCILQNYFHLFLEGGGNSFGHARVWYTVLASFDSAARRAASILHCACSTSWNSSPVCWSSQYWERTYTSMPTTLTGSIRYTLSIGSPVIWLVGAAFLSAVFWLNNGFLSIDGSFFMYNDKLIK